ncbi:MAG: beta-ketoacyl-[acyl-carrier-protein] synthase family protein [Chthoniobacteraceae bacterium]
MHRVVVTGLGFVTSIGNSRAEVLSSLREVRTGVEVFAPLFEFDCPVQLAGTVKGFEFPTPDPFDWILTDHVALKRAELRTMTPNAVFACVAAKEAIADAGLEPAQVSHRDTGFYCASAGSPWLTHEGLATVLKRGVSRATPPSVIASMPNSLHLNLTSHLRIKGASLSFSSACASSAHALGSAFDLIRSGRQKTMIVAGAEDCHPYNVLPFAALRALSVQTDPTLSPCAFDVQRDGFVVTGGSVVLILEERTQAEARGAQIYAEMAGWGQATDGYDVVAPDPSGDGLAAAMRSAMSDAHLAPAAIDYLNAHATSTLAGDLAEVAALKQVFADGDGPWISSTKSLTGHGLSLAGAMEAAFCCLALDDEFVPVSAHIRELDPACGGLKIATAKVEAQPQHAMSNSSGFGGANVALIFSKPEAPAGP